MEALAKFRVWVWLTAYRTEEARQCAADRGHLWTQAAACIVLALLRKLGD